MEIKKNSICIGTVTPYIKGIFHSIQEESKPKHEENKFAVKLHNIILFMLCSYLVVDSINGVLLREGFYSISFPYKLVILIFVIVYLRITKLLLYLIFLTLIYFYIHFLGNFELSQTVSSIIFLIRFFAIIIFFQFFKKLLINESDGEQKIFYFALISLFVLAANLILGLSGYGYAQYTSGEQEIGSRGFIYAGNELAGALVASASIVLMYLIKNNKLMAYFIVGIIFIGVSVITTTKLALLSSLLILIVFPLISASRRLHQLRFSKRKVLFAISITLVFPVIIAFSMYLVLYEMNLIERLAHFYAKSDFISFILSGRNVRANEAIITFANNYSLIEMIFGKTRNVICEIDSIDMLMKYGIFGVLLVYGFFGYVLLVSLQKRQEDEYGMYIVFMILLVVSISATAGHIIYSGTAGPLLSALLALGFKKSVFK